MPDLAGAEFLRIRRDGQESIDFPINEQVHRLNRWMADPTDILFRIKPD